MVDNRLVGSHCLDGAEERWEDCFQDLNREESRNEGMEDGERRKLKYWSCLCLRGGGQGNVG